MRQAIRDFVERTGNGHPDYDDITLEYLWGKLTQLKKLLEEEVEELQEAIDNKDIVEALDAVGDIEVFHEQMVYLLECMGINYKEASKEIDINNSLKYTTSLELAQQWAKDSGGVFECVGNISREDGVTYWCIKDESGKVRKHQNFPQVYLKDYVPDKWIYK